MAKLLPEYEHLIINSNDHAGALNDYFDRLDDFESPVVLLDVDCVPLDRDTVGRAVGEARRNGALVGIAQAACHVDPDEPYVGPAFMVFVPGDSGPIDFVATPHADVGQRISRCWPGIKRFLYPVRCRRPLWRVGNTPFGPGTYYGAWGESQVYHQFLAREARPEDVDEFVKVCETVLRGC